MSNVIKFPEVEESNSKFVETDKVRVWDTVYQVPVSIKIPVDVELDDVDITRQFFIKLCEYYGFEQMDIDRDPDSNATACLFYINGFFLPYGIVNHPSNSFNFKCDNHLYSILLESMAYEYDWPAVDIIEE